MDQEHWVKKMKEYCDPALVPAASRAPKKISGLLWLKGLPLPDVAACFSRGLWDQATLTLSVPVWKNFLVKNDITGKGLIAAAYTQNMTYHMKFKDDTLSEAGIKATFGGPKWGRMADAAAWAFGNFSEFPLIELTGTVLEPGSRWARPSHFGVADHKNLTNEYEAWKILDADLQLVEENLEMMKKLLPKSIGKLDILRYFDEPCDRSTNIEQGEEL